jgi:hypothetical protein
MVAAVARKRHGGVVVSGPADRDNQPRSLNVMLRTP